MEELLKEKLSYKKENAFEVGSDDYKIKVADYVVHYGNGSWVSAAEKMKRPKHMPAVEWLNKYKEYWSDNSTRI